MTPALWFAAGGVLGAVLTGILTIDPRRAICSVRGHKPTIIRGQSFHAKGIRPKPIIKCMRCGATGVTP